MTLEEIFNHGIEAAQLLFKKQGAVMPMWIAETADGMSFPIIAKMPDKDGRDELAADLKSFFKNHNVVRYVSILESWCVEVKSNGGIPRSVQLGASVSEHPDRREIVAIQAEEKNKDGLSGVFYILRPEHGEATLSPFKMSPSDAQAQGRFVGLLV